MIREILRDNKIKMMILLVAIAHFWGFASICLLQGYLLILKGQTGIAIAGEILPAIFSIGFGCIALWIIVRDFILTKRKTNG